MTALRDLPATPDVPGYGQLRLLGVGGMASVYLAVQESLGRQVALKLLNGGDSSRQQRFLNESRIIASLDHRNVVTIHDVGTVGGRPYIAMEYLKGGDLERRLDGRRVAPDEALDLVETMAACLDFVHRHGIIHRDIKPANILFHQDGTPILTDFGLAKQQESASHLTIDGTTVGTPYYISPEQAECKPVDGRTDIYGLGVIFYEMLTGTKPYEGASAMGTILAHIADPIPSLPSELSRYQPLVDRMLAKDPAARFASAGELLEYIHALRVGARPPGSLRTSARQAVSALRGAMAGNGDAPAGAGEAAPAARARRLLRRCGTTIVRHPRSAAAAALLAVALGLAAHGLTGAQRNVVPEQEAPAAQAPSAAERYLTLAEAALEEQRLSQPRASSALDYYQRVLALEPENRRALEGLALIAERYADLAEAEMSALRFQNARTYIARGLEIEPENRRLRLMEEQARPINAVPQRIGTNVRTFFDRVRRGND